MFGGFVIFDAFLRIGAPETNKIPEDRFLSEITENQKLFIASQGNVVISLDCQVCGIESFRLKDMTRKYSPFIFLVETHNNPGTTIELFGFRGNETISIYNETEVEDFICDNVAVKFNSCILRSIPKLNETIPL